MKLRIKGNSIRLRLGRSEVKRLSSGGAVEESTVFGPFAEERFVYAICASHENSIVSASFADRCLLVRVPWRQIQKWADTDEVGIQALQRTGDEEWLQILIEKDFECVEAPAGESQEDAFPNPKLEAACRPAEGVEKLI
jgi:hypothetical protein